MGGITSYTSLGERTYQEDRHLVINKDFASLLAVMDGHGGDETSDFCFQNLERIFERVLSKNKSFSGAIVKDLISELDQETKGHTSGSTISIVLISEFEENAHVGVLGDSPVVIKDKNGKVNISPEHNVRSNLKEKEEAKKRGGVYQGGYMYQPNGKYGLQLSRALGDYKMGEVISHEPEIYAVELGKDSFILVGSDGLFDPSHDDTGGQIKVLVKKINEGAEAENLVQDALDRGIRDNVTAILCRVY